MAIRTRVREFLTLAISDLARTHRSRRGLRHRRAIIESLEPRTLLTAYSVTNLNDAGAGSLRDAISLANANSGADEITFATSGTIALTTRQMVVTDSLTITGNGAANTIVDAQQLSRIFEVTDTAGNVTLNDMTFKNGLTRGNGTDFWDTTYAGGAVHWASPGVLTLNRNTFTGNSTLGERAAGGAILVAQGTLLVSECSFYANTTAGVNSEGGAISAQLGGFQVRNSTFSGNSTTGNYSEGGAIFSLVGNVSISQSTLSGNVASGIDSQGGGLFTQQGNIFIGQSTITENKATISAGGGIFTLSSPITILNSIVASNTDAGSSPDIRKSPDSSDVFLISNSVVGRNNGTTLAVTSGTMPDANGNFIGGATDATKINPKLGPLANNGGPTKTHALLTGSLAIDHGSNAAAVNVTNGNTVLVRDQRGVGFTRILDGDSVATAIVDMGAVEFPGLRLISPNVTTNALRPTLKWTSIAGATFYNIWINNESTGQAPYYRSSSTAASQTVTSDFAVGKYRVQIQPVFGAVNGNWNPPTSIFVLPPVVLATMPTVQLLSRPVISWNALPGAMKYDLWIDNVTTGQSQFVRQDVTGTSFTPSADLPMGSYRVWVRAVDKIGNFGAWSAVYQTNVLPGATPIGPLSATFDRTPTLSWQPVTGAVSYQVFVRNSSAVNVYNGQSTTATSWTPTVNLPDGQYRWWVIAVSAAGPKSGGATTTDLFVGGRPTVIAPTTGSLSSNKTPTFTWKAVDGAVSYNVWINRVDVSVGKIIYRTGLTGTSFTATIALPAGTYRVWVQGVSPTDSSPWSIQFDTAIFTITATSPTLDLLDDEWQLTGLLALDISRNNANAVQATSSLPPVDDRDHEEAAIDQIMAEIFLVPASGGR